MMTASSRENIFMEREVQSVKSGVVLSYPAGNGVIYFSPNNLRPPGGLSAVIDVYTRELLGSAGPTAPPAASGFNSLVIEISRKGGQRR